MNRTRALLIILLLVLLSSCSKASSENPTTDEEVPEMVMATASYTFGDENNNTVHVTSDSITVYDDKTVFEDVSLTQEDIEAHAENANVVDNSKISLSGGITVKSISDEASIYCETLQWDNTEKTIETDGTVVIEYNDGSYVNASKFQSDIDEGLYSFEGISKAVFVVDEETSFDIECPSFEYNSKEEILKTGSTFKISEVGKATSLSGSNLEFLKSESTLNITDGATFTKSEEDGLLTCFADVLKYDSANSILTIENNAVLTKEQEDGDITVSADNLVYDSEASSVTIENNVLFKKDLENGEFTCSTESATYEIAKGILTIDNNAHFTKVVGDSIVECSADSLFYETESKIVTVSGNISFEKETDQGLLKCTSDSMTFNTETQILSILGNPQINWGEDEYHASEVIINVETERIDLKGPVTGVIYG